MYTHAIVKEKIWINCYIQKIGIHFHQSAMCLCAVHVLVCNVREKEIIFQFK